MMGKLQRVGGLHTFFKSSWVSDSLFRLPTFFIHLRHSQEVDNVLVVVTRYWGGIHLGPDRFKHINQAARNALELGGFLDASNSTETGRKQGRGKGTGARR